MKTLTPRQKEILGFIKTYQKKNNYSPTLEEIAEHIGVSSVGTVHEHLSKLKEKGYIKHEENQQRSISLLDKGSTVSIPLAGIITAGEPIEPIEDPEPIEVPKSMVSKRGDYYALKVMGESMINEGIFEDDTVIVKKQDGINNGQAAVVYLPDENESTLKKVYREKNSWRLQPANPELKPRFEKNIEIKGRVVGVLRSFV